MKQGKDSFGEWLGKNAYAGLASFNKGLASTVDFLVPEAIKKGAGEFEAQCAALKDLSEIYGFTYREMK